MISLPPKPPRKKVETDIVREQVAAISRIRGVRCTRNNVGIIRDARGVPIVFGLGEGSPDIVGIVTFGGANGAEPSWVSAVGLSLLRTLDSIAVSFAIESKQDGKYATRKQRAWHGAARRRGLETAVCRSAEEATVFVQRVIDETALRIRRLAGGLA